MKRKQIQRFISGLMVVSMSLAFSLGSTGCTALEDVLTNVSDELIDNGTDLLTDKIDDLIDNGLQGNGDVINPDIEVKTLQEELDGDTYGLLYPKQREAFVGRNYYKITGERDLILAVKDGLSRGIPGIVLQYDTQDYKYWQDIFEKNKNRSEFGGYSKAGFFVDYSEKGELGIYPSFNETWQAITYYRYKEPEIGESTMKILEAAHKLAENAIKTHPDDEVGILSYVNEQICKMTVYADPIPKGLDVPERDAKGVFINGRAVCAGYAAAMELVLNILGIESYTLNNDERPEEAAAHIWNRVKVGDKWYHIDATWNDNSSDNVQYMHDYFMLTDSELAAKDSSTAHQWLPLVE
ncbi:MAG: hypothetical protein J6Y89_03910 [Lachnospiraceae bacterium]|nr:hypothetical protein [Lachnospiraceae bacterium]